MSKGFIQYVVLAVASVLAFGVPYYFSSKSGNVFGDALRVFTVPQGGTGASTFTTGECLKGNGTGALTTGACGSGSASINYNPFTAASFVGTSTATSTLSGGLYASLVSAPYFHATSTSATSTFANGINLTGGCFRKDGACLGSGLPGGAPTQVQFNDGGVFGGSSKLAWIDADQKLIIGAEANTGRIFAPDAVTSDTDGGSINILAGTGLGTGYGGTFTVDAGGGGATSSGGDVELFAGWGGASSGAGGSIYIEGGSASGGNSSGGNLVLTAGNKLGSGLQGNFQLLNGNVGIGTTTPYSRLSVWGAGTGATSVFELTNSASTTLASVLNDGTFYMKGNVGIGTANPSSLLTVGTNTTASTGGIGFGTDSGMWRTADGTIRLGSVATDNAILFLSGTSGSFGGLLGGTTLTLRASRTSSSLGFQTTNSGGNPVTAMTIDSSQNVGIGTTAPGSKLQISTGNSEYLPSTSGFSLRKNEEGYGLFSGVAGSGNSWLQAGTSNDATNYNLILQSRGGNVGIGTTAPGVKLDVLSGTANTAADSITNPTINITGPNRAIGSGSSNSAILSIASNDTLGADIGGSLSFGGRYTGTAQATWGVIKGAKENATDGQYGSYMAFATRANGSGLVEAMRINSAGNVGIGTTEPLSKLEVNSDAGITWGAYSPSLGAVTIGRTNTLSTVSAGSLFVRTPGFASGYDVGIGITGTAETSSAVDSVQQIISYGTKFSGYGSSLSFSTTNGTAVNEAMRINRSGNVGIGTTSPYSLLSVSGSSGLALTNTGAGNTFYVEDAANDTTPFVIDASGNVGIGTTTPVNKFTVAGDIGFYGTIPALTSCGTSPAITKGSTDSAGEITFGTISTGCVITFATSKTNAPFVVLSSQAGLVFTYTVSNTAITITNVGALSGTKLNYIIITNNN